MVFMHGFEFANNQFGEASAAFARCLTADLPGNADFSALERAALRLSEELVRRHLESVMQTAADAQTREMSVDGILYRRHALGTVKYHSLCGGLRVRRFSYRVVGERNGRTCIPLDLQFGIVEGATPAFAFCVAQGYAKGPIRGLEQDLLAAHRSPPSRSTMERLALRLGGKVRETAVRIETHLRATEELTNDAFAINLGLDRTTVPIAEDEPISRKNGSKVKGPPATHRVLRYRMAYVGTVCVTDQEGNALLTRRYAAPAHAGAATVIARMMKDLRWARQQRPTLNVGVVQDGATELWNRMRAALFDEFAFKGRRWGVHLWKRLPWRETIDWYHLMGHLYAALQVLVKDKSRQQEILNSWKSLLSRDEDGIKTIAKWLTNEASGTKGEVWWKVQNVLNYINVPNYFRYASLNELGLHKGSGVTEGACKSLITKRTKRSGQRFRPRGISAVLAVRSLLDSDRLARFWEIFAQRYVAQCCAA
jgi:hypothetical protein